MMLTPRASRIIFYIAFFVSFQISQAECKNSNSDEFLHLNPSQLSELKWSWPKWARIMCAQRLAKMRAGKELIGADPVTVHDGFRGMSEEDFKIYNDPQVWVERRTIPLSISGRIPIRHAVVIDLGSGPGTSVNILAHFADPSWKITGYELDAELVRRAKVLNENPGFWNSRGERISAEFFQQDVSRPLLNADGHAVASESVDFAFSGGVVGLYMDVEGVKRLAKELGRVMKIGAYIAIDSGPAIPPKLLRRIFENSNAFAYETRVVSSFLDPRPKLIFQKLPRR